MSNKRDDTVIKDALFALSQELDKKEPSIEQDAVFQENLSKNLPESGFYENNKTMIGLVASIFVVTFFIISVFFETNTLNQAVDSTLSDTETSTLISQSNVIEHDISQYDPTTLSPAQYVEVVRLRGEVERIDQLLNAHYQSESGDDEQRAVVLWKERLKNIQSLRAVYSNQYIVARI
ncbi:hypothetical protein [Kangiella marina]|uniref:Uncharacterized protein n=1 Tax=Kangiella marina TaxID=1079178 RepID=A0ABP8I9G8_9GAMM